MLVNSAYPLNAGASAGFKGGELGGAGLQHSHFRSPQKISLLWQDVCGKLLFFYKTATICPANY